MKKLFLHIMLLSLSFVVPSAHAGDFATPEIKTLLQTLIRYGAININKDDIIDDYGMIAECKLYKKFYSDDFKWQKIRDGLREIIRKEAETYATGYHYDTKLQLDRYDFKAQLFRFKEQATVKNVNAFTISNGLNEVCEGEKLKVLPAEYRLVLDESLYMPGLPFTETDANALLKRLVDAGNKDRIVSARFNIRVVYVPPLTKLGDHKGYTQTNHESHDGTVRLDSRLYSVDMYEDEAMTKLIYSYQPL